MNLSWLQIEEYLQKDDRCVFPIGSTEQHAYLRLSTDSVLAERISSDAAAPLGVPVFPVLNYGHTPLFMDFPGTVSLRKDTLWNVVKDVIESLSHHGFRKILIVNGHGGNMFLSEYITGWLAANPNMNIKFHNWWRAASTWKIVNEIDPVASHASWMENFLWTRLQNASQPQAQKPMVDLNALKNASPQEARKLLVDGNYGGYYQRSDEDMQRIWNTAVAETRELIENNW